MDPGLRRDDNEGVEAASGLAVVELADYLGERLAPGARRDAEGLADPAAIEHRVGRAARRGRVVGGGDRLDQRRWPAPPRRQLENRLGETVPGHRAAAGEMIGAPEAVPGIELLHDRADRRG